MEANRYPIDYESLRKGDVIPVEKLEELSGEKRGTQEFEFAVLKWKEIISTHMAAINNPVTIVGHNTHSLRVLTDLEASEYHDKRALAHLKGMKRNLAGLIQVDTDEFDPSLNSAHLRRIEVVGKMVQGGIKGRREGMKAVPYERSTPGLLSNTNSIE